MRLLIQQEPSPVSKSLGSVIAKLYHIIYHYIPIITDLKPIKTFLNPIN